MPTNVPLIGKDKPLFLNPVDADKIGHYRKREVRKSITADSEVIRAFLRKKMRLPSFLEAGPRKFLLGDPAAVKAGIIITGGLAPGIHHVIHSIVDRHWNTYGIKAGEHRGVFGIRESYK